MNQISNTTITSLDELPPAISFFCPNCVDGTGLKIGPYGEPIDCKECSNHRILASQRIFVNLTRDYCIPAKSIPTWPITDGVYYVLLFSDRFLSELVDLNDLTDAVRTARFIKDRFFFTRPLPDDIVNDHSFFNNIAWIPK